MLIFYASLLVMALAGDLLIDPNSLNEEYYLTNEQIEIYVGITDGQAFQGEEVYLTIEGQECIYGSLFKKSVTGHQTIFFPIKMLCPGNFTITANSESLKSSPPQKFEVRTNILSMHLNVPSDVDIYTNFYITFGLYDSKGSMWTNEDYFNVYSYETTFKCNNNLKNIKFNGPEITIECSLGKSGDHKIMFESSTVNKTGIVHVNPLYFKFESKFPENTMSDTPISVSIQGYYSTGVKVTDAHITFSVYLELQCFDLDANPCSGNLLHGGGSINNPKTTLWGAYTFNEVYIKSSGRFQMLVYDANDRETYGFSDPFNSKNKVKTIKIEVSSKLASAFTYIQANLSVIGEDNGPYLSPSTLYFEEVSYSGRSLLGGFTSIDIDPTNKNISSNIYFTNFGKKKLRGRIGSAYGDSDYLEIKKNKIVISEVEEPVPKDTRDPFNFYVRVYDWEGINLIEEVDVPITISTSPESELSGETEYVTKNGVAYIKNLVVKDGGNYRLAATAGSNTEKSETKYDIESVDCGIGYGPIFAMVVLLVIGIIVSTVFAVVDHHIKTFQYVRFKVLAVHPLSGLFMKQPNYRRALLCMHIASTGLLLLAIIGAIYGYYDTPTTHYNRSFDDYKNKEVYKGATAWALCQILSIPLFFLVFKAGEKANLIKISVICSFVLMVLSTGAIIGMTVKYCLGYFVYWIINFMIFILFEVFFSQIIYSFIAVRFITKFIRFEMENKLGKQSTEDFDNMN